MDLVSLVDRAMELIRGVGLVDPRLANAYGLLVVASEQVRAEICPACGEHVAEGVLHGGAR